jgi:hypothetical protein
MAGMMNIQEDRFFAFGSQHDQSTFNSVNKNDSDNYKVEDHNEY